MHKGCGLFDTKKSKASNSKAKLLDQNNFINLAFAVKVVMVTVGLRAESILKQLL